MFRSIAEECSVSVQDVRNAVHSFFGVILAYSRHLPFDDQRKIFRREKFEEYSEVFNIPYIGRIGPSYSRYLSWRKNEALFSGQVPRSNYRTKLTQDEIEHIAEEILSGKTPSSRKKTKPNELYNRIWLVDKDSKKLARQVLPKQI